MASVHIEARSVRFASHTASTGLIALIALCLMWESWLAPLRPGGSWLILKAVPLLFPLFGILHGHRYTYQWSSLLIQLYLLEGLTRIISDSGITQWLAAIEILLSFIFLAATLAYCRMTAPSRIKVAD